jgi:GH18 family chitinase
VFFVVTTLFTHLFCAFAGINSSTYEISFSSSGQQYYFSNFTATVKQKNLSITTLLSVGGANANPSIYSLMANSSVSRKSFIDSWIKTARLYGFQGIDLYWVWPKTSSDVTNMTTLLEECRVTRVAVESEANNSSQPQLILTAAAHYSPDFISPNSVYSLPVDSMQKNLDWLNLVAYHDYSPFSANYTRAVAALHDPETHADTDDGIKAWIARGLSANKLVLGLPLFGYMWTLKNSQKNGIGAPVTGLVTNSTETNDKGSIAYNDIK